MTAKEEIAVIGGGLGGCLSALMLAKNPRYHVTLIEANDTLLNGASVIASRLHLGGEYPLDEQTAQDCLNGAVMWKLLMPDDIYTKVPPTRFLIDKDTQAFAEKNPNHDEKLDLALYEASYEKIRQRYEEIFQKVQSAYGWDEATTGKALFGSPQKDIFYRKLKPQEHADYVNIAGGFQTQEMGLNVPKYLSMIQGAIKEQQRAGNLSVLTGHKVVAEGIEGEIGHFNIHCKHGQEEKTVKASQVVQAAWQGGMEITPIMGADKGVERQVVVHQRAMLMVDLPKNAPWKTSPAFIMLGPSGGMLAPYNDHVAICYIPTPEAAYRRQYSLTADEPSLPQNWNELLPEKKEQWTKSYFNEVKRRFPSLAEATNPRLIIRDTLNFQHDNYQRQYEMASEAIAPPASMKMAAEMKQQQNMEAWAPAPAFEVRRGLFLVYPTKATYSVHAALQARAMVDMRSQNPAVDWVKPPDSMLDALLAIGKKEEMSLAGMKEPDKRSLARFFAEHPDLDKNMLKDSWPGITDITQSRHSPKGGHRTR